MLNHVTEPEKAALEAKFDQEIKQTRERQRQKPALFLAAWKEAIEMAGEEYFKLQCNVDEATDKNQLCPNFDMIKNSLFRLSTGQAQFLAALYSFYNDQDGQKLLEALNRPNHLDLCFLDDDRLDIITRLLLSYNGW